MILYLALIAAGGALFWARKTRDPRAVRIGDVMAVLAVLIALKVMKTNPPLAMISIGAAGWWFWARKNMRTGPTAMTKEEASRLLDVPIDATSAEVRAAHRRLVARVHPDVGGSADLTRQVNAARDTLMHRG